MQIFQPDLETLVAAILTAGATQAGTPEAVIASFRKTLAILREEGIEPKHGEPPGGG